MQIMDKVEKFYLENEDIIWKAIFVVGVGAYGAYLGYLFGAARGINQGFKAGCDASEALMAAMEPEAYARICQNAQEAVKILMR